VLAFQFYSARLLVNRPCLCNFDDKADALDAADAEFRSQSARTCIDAARTLISFIPSTWGPEAIRLVQQGPWWALIHHIVSAGVALMIELLYDAEHAPELAEEMLADSGKVVGFLQSMGKDNLAAKRSAETLAKMLNVIAPHIQTKDQEELSPGLAMPLDSIFLDDPQMQLLPLPHSYTRQVSDDARFNIHTLNPDFRNMYEEIMGQLPTILPYEERYIYSNMGIEDNSIWNGKSSSLFLPPCLLFFLFLLSSSK